MRRFPVVFYLIIILLLAACQQMPDSKTPPSIIETSAPAASATMTAATAAATATAPIESTPVATTPAGQPVTIRSTHMIDQQNGWAVGSLVDTALQRIFRTSDGGSTWKDVTPPEQSANAGATNTAALTAWFGGEDGWVLYYSPVPAPSSDPVFVWHTTDSGQSWTAGDPISLDNLTMDFFLPADLGFSDGQNGWLMAHLGAGMSHDYVAVYRTADSGKTWTRTVDPSQETLLKNGLPMTCVKTGLTFLDGQNGFAAGNCNGVLAGVFLYRTDDGGTMWSQVAIPDPVGQAGLLAGEQNACGSQPPIFTDAQHGYLPVNCQAGGTPGRWLYQTSDGGATWQGYAAPTSFGSAEFIKNDQGFFLGFTDDGNPQVKTLYTTANGGKNWEKLANLSNMNGVIDFIDSQNGWAVAKLDNDRTRLMRSQDGGRSWQEVLPMLVP